MHTDSAVTALEKTLELSAKSDRVAIVRATAERSTWVACVDQLLDVMVDAAGKRSASSQYVSSPKLSESFSPKQAEQHSLRRPKDE